MVVAILKINSITWLHSQLAWTDRSPYYNLLYSMRTRNQQRVTKCMNIFLPGNYLRIQGNKLPAKRVCGLLCSTVYHYAEMFFSIYRIIFYLGYLSLIICIIC